MFKKIVSSAVTGIAIAYIIANIMIQIFLQDRSGAEIINSYTLWMVSGLFYGLVSLVYQTSLNKFVTVGLHLLSNLIISFVSFEIMFRCIMGESVDFGYHYLLIIFTIIYICVTLVVHLFNKIDAKKLNKKLYKSQNND